MCVIAICKTRRLTAEEITRMDAANPHGIGIAWVNPRLRLVEYIKGLTADEAIARVARVPLPHIVHFRFASVGAVTPLLSHPFPLSEAPALDLAGAAPSVLFHNGTWMEWQAAYTVLAQAGVYLNPTEPWSDSRVMAVLMARHAPGQIADVVGRQQRLAVLRGTGKVELFGTFVTHRGVLVSNTYWDRPPVQWTDHTPAWLDDEETEPPDPQPRKAKAKPKGRNRRAKAKPKAQAALFVDQPTSRPESKYFPRVPRPTWPSRW
jgi:hypothetical protein